MSRNIAIRAIKKLAYKKNLELLGEDLMNMPTLSNTVKGILFMVAGAILLLNILGITTELMHSVILFGSIGMIVLGFFMAGFHTRIISLIRKKESSQTPPSSNTTAQRSESHTESRPEEHTDNQADSSKDDHDDHQQF